MLFSVFGLCWYYSLAVFLLASVNVLWPRVFSRECVGAFFFARVVSFVVVIVLVWFGLVLVALRWLAGLRAAHGRVCVLVCSLRVCSARTGCENRHELCPLPSDFTFP